MTVFNRSGQTVGTQVNVGNPDYFRQTPLDEKSLKEALEHLCGLYGIKPRKFFYEMANGKGDPRLIWFE